MTPENVAVFRLLLPLLLAVSLLMPLTAGASTDKAHAAYDARNYRAAMRLYRPLAEDGNAEAQYYVGRMYEKGQGVRKDPAEGARWYRRAAEGGHAPAQYRLAVGYAFGLGGLKKDEEAALKWLRRSAEGGYKRAQKVLGQAYAEGRFGLPVDREQADYWTKRAEASS